MSHLDEGTLHAFLDGETTPVENEALERHLTGCRECQARLAEARTFRDQAFGLIETLDEAEALAGAGGLLAEPAGAMAPMAAALSAPVSSRTAEPQPHRTGPRRTALRWAQPIAWAATVVLAVGIGYALGADRASVAAPMSDQLAAVATAAAPLPAPAETAPAGDRVAEAGRAATTRDQPSSATQEESASPDRKSAAAKTRPMAPAAVPPADQERERRAEPKEADAAKKAESSDVAAAPPPQRNPDSTAGTDPATPRSLARTAAPAEGAAGRLFATRPLKVDKPTGTEQEVSGVVLDSRTGRALDGARVLVQGAPGKTALSDARGRFRLPALSGASVNLRIMRIGYQSVSVPARVGEDDLQVPLAEVPFALNELTVTATAEGAARRSLGNAVAKVRQDGTLSADEAIQALGGSIKLIDGMTAARYEIVDSLVRITYRTLWGPLMLEEWRDDDELQYRLIVPAAAPADSTEVWNRRIR